MQPGLDELAKDHCEELYASSPSACLLRQAALSPESVDGDKDIDVDLYQAAVIVLAHLDRLATPFLPSLSSPVLPYYLLLLPLLGMNNNCI